MSFLRVDHKRPSGILASCARSYGQAGPCFLQIHGDAGYLELQPGFDDDGIHPRGSGTQGPVEIASTGKNPYQFTREPTTSPISFATTVNPNPTTSKA